MIHRFQKSLQHERDQAEKADRIYREVLKATDIVRFNTDSESDMEMQRQDIDLLLTIRGTTFKISEKFRDKDYGDLYIEVYSKYPHTKGWMHTGKPNAIIYFTPTSVYWITHNSLFECFEKILLPAIPEVWYLELYQSQQSICTKKVQFKDIETNIQLIQAHNFEGKAWETIGISIQFDVLTKLSVKFKKI
ncbi:MAG: hypothetical protein ACOYM7_10405 [Paludibacter sp.]